MSWTWLQRQGELLHDGHPVAAGYSGMGAAKNIPEAQTMHGLGPIPCGRYTVRGPPFSSEHMGPYVLALDPDPGNAMFGRSGFCIHGDSNPPGEASRGCIILARRVRELIRESGDFRLEVVSGEEPRKGSDT